MVMDGLTWSGKGDMVTGKGLESMIRPTWSNMVQHGPTWSNVVQRGQGSWSEMVRDGLTW